MTDITPAIKDALRRESDEFIRKAAVELATLSALFHSHVTNEESWQESIKETMEALRDLVEKHEKALNGYNGTIVGIRPMLADLQRDMKDVKERLTTIEDERAALLKSVAVNAVKASGIIAATIVGILLAIHPDAVLQLLKRIF